jgi:hypothetical protein
MTNKQRRLRRALRDWRTDGALALFALAVAASTALLVLR